MNTDNTTIENLKLYASTGIHELAKQDGLLLPLIELIDKYINISNDARSLTNEEAKRITKYIPGSSIGRPFDVMTVKNYYEIGSKVLDIACGPRSNNTHMLKVAAYLHPLFSQDDRTIDMGFDLEEYMDWYFNETTEQERRESAEQLIADWTMEKKHL
jgi:hypothetical protein